MRKVVSLVSREGMLPGEASIVGCCGIVRVSRPQPAMAQVVWLGTRW